MDAERRLTPGERIPGLPADTWNSFVDAARWVERRRSTPSPGVDTPYQSKDVIRVRNGTGGGLGMYSVVRISAPIISSQYNEDKFKEAPVDAIGLAPAGNHDRLAVLLEPAASNKIVSAAVCGVVPIQLTGDATDGAYASSSVGVTATMKTGGYGHRILWRQEAIGPCWGLVSLHDRNTPIGLANVSGLTPSVALLVTASVVTWEGETLASQSVKVYGSTAAEALPASTNLFVWYQDGQWSAVYSAAGAALTADEKWISIISEVITHIPSPVTAETDTKHWHTVKIVKDPVTAEITLYVDGTVVNEVEIKVDENGHIWSIPVAAPCPEECDDCPTCYIVTLDGFISETIPAAGGNCINLNGTYQLDKSTDPDQPCWWNWYSEDFSDWAWLSCEAGEGGLGEWVLFFEVWDGGGPANAKFTAPNTTGCPPLTGWVIDDIDHCTSGSITISECV